MKQIEFLGSSLKQLRDSPKAPSAKPDAIYVLHAFEKKTEATAKRKIELAGDRLNALMQRRRTG